MEMIPEPVLVEQVPKPDQRVIEWMEDIEPFISTLAYSDSEVC